MEIKGIINVKIGGGMSSGMDIVYEKLCEIVGKSNVYTEEDMRKHTTFKAGGKAKYFVTPDSIEIIKELILYLRDNIPYYVIGNGSNLLVRDEGYDGVIIKLGQKFAKYTIENNSIKCQSGAFVSKIANEACEHGLSGLEFAAGIPGMIGGAAAMNAGAYDGEFKDVIENVTVMDKNGNIIVLSNEDMHFGYRKSIVWDKEYIVLEVSIILEKGEKNIIREKMEKFLTARREKQPLEYPSAGSTFKRPEGYFAGKLIMDAGLRGYSVGDACVSEKHCGFVINRGNAKAADIIKLINDIKKIVKDKYDVELETEVKII